MLNTERYQNAIAQSHCRDLSGKLTAIHGLILEASAMDVKIGEIVQIHPARGGQAVSAEVVGLREDKSLLMPLASASNLCLASRVHHTDKPPQIPVGTALLGRVINATGEALDGRPLSCTQTVPLLGEPINPLHRSAIVKALATGVRAVDTFTPLGRGQRIGIFAGSGVGKSTLLGMMARHTEADVIVIALIGERGREVGDFIRDALGTEGMKRAVVVVASADNPAILRRQAAYTATAIAEWFRGQDKHVLLIMDSITRFAMAQREIGLATGEPLGTRGYPPSTFSLLPPLLERAGALQGEGSITAIYTVLVEGDDFNEPVSDHMRALLDGHIMLNRDLVAAGHYPAIDVLHSVSRLSSAVLNTKQKQQIDPVRQMLAQHSASRDLIDMGAYERGSNPLLDQAIHLKPEIDRFLKQAPDEYSSFAQSWDTVAALANKAQAQASSHG